MLLPRGLKARNFPNASCFQRAGGTRKIKKLDKGIMKNREIKFRAWDKKRNKMLIPAGIYEDGMPFIRYNDGENAMPLNDYPIMQYTGLKDKNGLEVYEGDIVLRNNRVKTAKPQWSTKKYVVLWNEERAGFCLKEEETWAMIWELEVIGNVWENPELLDKGRD